MSKGNGHSVETSVIEFPCDFTLKIMGKSGGSFEKIALAIIRSHFPEIDHLEKKLSKNEKYLSLSVTIYVETKEQLDALYRELSGNEAVLMVL